MLVRLNRIFHIAKRVRKVVGRFALILVRAVKAITLRDVLLGERTLIHRQHLVVVAQAVTMRVIVAEQAALQHLVGRRLHARDHVSRREGDLLHVGKVVGGILVEHELAHRMQRILLVRPHLGHVERIERDAVRLVVVHKLHVQRPRGILLVRDGVEQVLGGIVRILAVQLSRLVLHEVLDALVRLEVKLDPRGLALRVHQLERVRAVAVHVTIAVRYTTITLQKKTLDKLFSSIVDIFLTQTKTRPDDTFLV